MNGSPSNTEKDFPCGKPLSLSRRCVVTLVAAGLGLWIAGLLLWGQREADKWLVMSQNGLRVNDIIIHAGQMATRYGMAVMTGVYLIYLLLAFKFENLRDAHSIYLTVFFLFGIAGICGDLLNVVLNRPRPFIQYAGEFHAFSKSATASFPSGHATKSTALALPFLFLITAKDTRHRAVKILLAVVALCVCYSRVLLGAHFVSDVLAGIGTALIFLPPATFLTGKLWKKMTPERLRIAVRVWALLLAGLLMFLLAAT